MPGKTHINITIDSAILNWIDRLRGQNPRSTFINSVLDKFCVKEQEVFDWSAEIKKSDADIDKKRVHKFTDPKKAVRWLKS
jgi:hypothetical protein